MAIYSFKNNQFEKIGTTTFGGEGLLERQHIQAALKRQIDIVSPDCLVISEEFSEWSGSLRRIDLLAIDKQANLVVIELKRNETGDYMELQALRYAAMVSTLTFSRAIEIYQKYLVSIENELNARNSLLDFLNWEEPQEENFALDVHIILVSSNFSKELTTSVMWLNERNVSIRCVRIIPYKYENQVFIDVQQIIPLPEVESYQIKIRQQSEERREARESQRDFTRYIFMGTQYNKRKLVLAVIHQWIKDNKPNALSELSAAFPQGNITVKIFTSLIEAKEIFQRTNIPRHFLAENEIVSLPDGSQHAISNQWGVGNMEEFIKQARSIGLEVTEIIKVNN
ncbi:MAG: hypothetical protein ABL933_03235 [Methyloglobulus sp.]|nr:hypothetical protein [Methyloglobulus sp.]